MNLIERDTNKDAIMTYLLSDNDDPTSLSDKQLQLLQYYTDAYTLTRNYKSVPDAIKVLVKLSKQRGEPISESTARRYVYAAQDVYGYASKTKAEGHRHYSMEVIKDAIAIARDQNNPDAMIRGAEALIKISGADQQEIFNAEMLERHIIEMNLDKKTENLIRYAASKGLVDLDNFLGNAMNAMAEDAIILNDTDESTELSS